VPEPVEVERAVAYCQSGQQAKLTLAAHESKTAWLTAGFFAFQAALGVA
jgi:hypothetical protein